VAIPTIREHLEEPPSRRPTVPSGSSARRFDEDEDGRRPRGVPAALAVAGLASLGAGAIHASAAAAHGEHRAAVVAFVAVALAQLVWGAYALVRSNRLLVLAGAAVNAAAVGGWVLAKTSGIGFVSGLESSEPAQFADTAAAVLGAVAVVGAVVALGARVRAISLPRPWLTGVAAVAAVGLTVPAMVATGGHSHADGHGHGGDAHDHGTPAAQPASPYMGTKPVDLGGVPGVSAEEQARAESLVERAIDELPQFADVNTLAEKGYYSIGDAFTGDEHFINWNLINDGVLLDPSQPESLVYEPQPDGTKKLVAAMFMMPDGSTLDDAPNIGGPLTQWHIHDNLCFNNDPVSPRLTSVTDSGGSCPAGTTKFDPSPMIHVWITPHPCGPFAALEGVGGGQIAPGETRLCDTAHGHG